MTSPDGPREAGGPGPAPPSGALGRRRREVAHEIVGLVDDLNAAMARAARLGVRTSLKVHEAPNRRIEERERRAPELACVVSRDILTT